MLSHTFEFIRIADPKPDAEKVSKRTNSATDLLALIAAKPNREVLLGCVQGTIAGFGGALTNDSPAVVAALKAIKDHDVAISNDLSENSEELRACAALAVGELLAKHGPKSEALTAALAIRSGLALRPHVKERHLNAILQKLSRAAEDLVALAATSRRQRSANALRKLQNLDEPAEPKDVWKTIMLAVRSTLRELYEHATADREEIESLWWTFQGYSELAGKPLSEMSPTVVAICAGIELADRALVPPLASGAELVRRAVEHGRKESQLTAVALQDIVAEWPNEALTSFSPVDGAITELSGLYPALLPLTYTCRVRRETTAGGKWPKGLSSMTGFQSAHTCPPAEWSIQVFHERILQRVLTDTHGS